MWAAFFEELREHGRSGHVFVLIMLLIFAGALFGVPGIGALFGLLAVYLGWVCMAVRSQQERFERLGQQPPLASADLRVARVKLAKSQTQRLMAERSQRLKTQRCPTTTNTATSGPLRLRLR
ncbi:MAG TPA: hypothetical protein VJS65_02295 [Verrucomicrobiae bacterium]|nr:hypothetical protein [Verrucomicrobiae bacterium]